jgi:hypothetical protein
MSRAMPEATMTGTHHRGTGIIAQNRVDIARARKAEHPPNGDPGKRKIFAD